MIDAIKHGIFSKEVNKIFNGLNEHSSLELKQFVNGSGFSAYRDYLVLEFLNTMELFFELDENTELNRLITMRGELRGRYDNLASMYKIAEFDPEKQEQTIADKLPEMWEDYGKMAQERYGGRRKNNL